MRRRPKQAREQKMFDNQWTDTVSEVRRFSSCFVSYLHVQLGHMCTPHLPGHYLQIQHLEDGVFHT